VVAVVQAWESVGRGIKHQALRPIRFAFADCHVLRASLGLTETFTTVLIPLVTMPSLVEAQCFIVQSIPILHPLKAPRSSCSANLPTLCTLSQVGTSTVISVDHCRKQDALPHDVSAWPPSLSNPRDLSLFLLRLSAPSWCRPRSRRPPCFGSHCQSQEPRSARSASPRPTSQASRYPIR